MSIDIIILLAAGAVFALSLLLVPKANRLQAPFVLLFIQFPIWLLGLVVVELGLLRYPVHELARSNSTSFIFEYIVLPVYCVHFNVRFPQRAKALLKALYYCGASLLLTGFEVLIEKYTDILEYTGWQWYMTFISVLFILWLSRIMAIWFFRKYRPQANGGS